MTVPVGFPEIATQLAERPEVVRPTARTEDAPSFSDRLEQLAETVNDSQREADVAATEFANGTQNDIHGTMITMQQADIQLRFAANVRNRLIEAYREIMRMGA